MTIREREDELFSQWRRGRANFNSDGVVDEAVYLASQTKILFLLKEVNGKDGAGFDLRHYLAKGGRPQSWNNVARGVKALRRLEQEPAAPLPWSDFKRITSAERRSMLQSICAVNLKKTGGGHTTNERRLAAAFEADKEHVERQLGLYPYDLIVCCGSVVARLSKQLAGFPDGKWRRTLRGMAYEQVGPRRYLLAHSHPEARCAHQLLFYGFTDAVRELLMRVRIAGQR